MSAVPSAIPESKAAEQRAHESSMEEILASIRKIIADDQALPLTPRLPRAEPAPIAYGHHEQDEDRMYPPASSRPPVDISGAFAVPPPPRQPRPELPPLQPVRPAAPAVDTRSFAPPHVLPAPPQRPVDSDIHSSPRPAPSALLSEQANHAVASAFQALNSARSAAPSAETLEAMAREMLRPMLKQWLDDNLPTMVERLVRAEIERVARGGR
jgi:cell pole-organizing protein PopZ